MKANLHYIKTITQEMKEELIGALVRGIAYCYDNKKHSEPWTNAELGKYGVSAISILEQYLFPILDVIFSNEDD